MTEQIRWGILSTANIGRKRVIPAIKESRNGFAAAVASRGLEAAQSFAAEMDIPTAYGSYEALIADPDVDAIYIPLPNRLHAGWSLKCAEAGKPTLCEKPLAANAAEAQTMVDAFAERGVLFAEAFMYRFHPQTLRVKALLDEGAIGPLKTMTAAFSFYLDDARAAHDIRLSKTLAGGSLMDVGCYCVNVMRLMTGEEPEAAAALALDWSSGVDETLAGVLRFPSGVVAHFDSSVRGFLAHRYELRGETGRLVVGQGFVMGPDGDTTLRLEKNDGSVQTITIPAANSYTLMVEDFAAALLDGRPPRFSPQDGVLNMAVIDRLLASL